MMVGIHRGPGQKAGIQRNFEFTNIGQRAKTLKAKTLPRIARMHADSGSLFHARFRNLDY
jgi:hypothetical protein